MYHPTTRLLTLLELLQARGRVSGTELARRLEVDGRSVRRYVGMLQDLGIPIEGTRGPYGGYRLLPGYKLPPLLFSEDEGVALILGLLGLRHTGLALAPEAVEGALAKVDRVLPAAARARVQALQAHLALDAPGESSADGTLVVLLSEAAARGQSVVLRYRSERGEETERVVDPYGVVAAMRSWYLVGYCHLRQGLRLFRLDRIQDAAPREERFTPPSDFDALGYVLPRIAAWGGSGAVEVVLGLNMAQARRRVPPGTSTLEPASDGVILRTQAHNLDALARFLLGLGCSLAVREPPALKDALRRVAREIMHVAESA